MHAPTQCFSYGCTALPQDYSHAPHDRPPYCFFLHPHFMLPATPHGLHFSSVARAHASRLAPRASRLSPHLTHLTPGRSPPPVCVFSCARAPCRRRPAAGCLGDGGDYTTQINMIVAPLARRPLSPPLARRPLPLSPPLLPSPPHLHSCSGPPSPAADSAVAWEPRPPREAKTAL